MKPQKVKIMAQTSISTSSALARKKWAGLLFSSVIPESYWGTRFMREGSPNMPPNTPIHLISDLEKEDGDAVYFELAAQLRGRPTFDSDQLEGNEEDLSLFSDSVKINQVRHAVDTGGTMTRKRTVNDLRMVARGLEADWRSRWMDESIFMTISGARGMNEDYIEPSTVTYAIKGTPLVARDAEKTIYAGDATSKASMSNDDYLTLSSIDKAVTKAETEGGGSDGVIRIKPIRINGEDKFVCLMHTWQEHYLRTNTATGQWLDIQKAASTNNGAKNPIFTGSLGEYRGVVLHKHNKVTRFNDYGAGSNLAAARALFLGQQAMVLSFGNAYGGARYDWVEEWRDYKERLGVSTKCIVGMKRPQFDNKDVNSIVIDSYAPKPY
jgi:N4-gp56 family major capsid protein